MYDDCVRNEIFGKIRIIGVTVKSKLKHASTGDLEIIAELGNVGRDDTEILGDKWQSAQFFFYRIEKIRARTRHPLAGLGGRCSGRYMPRGAEPAEMIETNHIHKSEKRAEAIDAPAITALPQDFPVIDGVPPELSLRTEVIRRHAGDKVGRRCSSSRKSSGFAQTSLESGETKKGKLPIRRTLLPDRIHEALALAEQQELSEANLLDFARQLTPGPAKAAGSRRTPRPATPTYQAPLYFSFKTRNSA